MPQSNDTGGRSRRRRQRLLIVAGVAVAALALAATALVLTLTGVAPNPFRGSARHVVFLVLDTVRADRMSLYGHSRDTTPFLNSVADDLLVYEGGKAPAPWTVPSHTSMFTGLWPSVHHAQWGRITVDEGLVTLAEVLSGAGFEAYGFSANPFIAEDYGFAQGFTDLEVIHAPHLERTELLWNYLPPVFERMAAPEGRVMLFVNLMDAHLPYNSARYGKTMGAPGGSPLRSASTKWKVNAGLRKLSAGETKRHGYAYDAAIRYLDDKVRDLFTELERRRILDETLIVITSDHGDGLGLHPEMGHSISVWEEQLAVPLVLRLPDGDRGGERVSSPTSTVALMPTILDLLEVPRPAALRGALDLDELAVAPVTSDYRSYFSDASRDINRSATRKYPELAARITHAHVLYCADTYKLVARANGGRELYDLSRDTRERTNLLATRPTGGPVAEAATACTSLYERLLLAGRFTPFDLDLATVEAIGAGRPTPTPDLEVLKSLGYVDE